MIIIEPVANTDTGFSRASTANYYDVSGVLQSAAANIPRFNYTPSDLTKAPYLLVESAATNLQLYSHQFDQATWTKSNCTVLAGVITAPDGTSNADGLVEDTGSALKQLYQLGLAITSGLVYTSSIYVKDGGRSKVYAQLYNPNFGAGEANFDLSAETVTAIGTATATITKIKDGWYRCTITATATAAGPAPVAGWSPSVTAGDVGTYTGDGASGIYIWGAQVEVGSAATSYIATVAATVTRSADVISTPTNTFITSNVLENDYPVYNTGTTYALSDYVIDTTTHGVYQSLQAGNLNKPLPVSPATTTAWWIYISATNRHKMFDSYNNTQTQNTDVIHVALSPQIIAQGVFLGNIDCDTIGISVYDDVEGFVYSEVQSMAISNSGSSFYNWYFKRIQSKSSTVSVLLPPYEDATITITLRKTSGTAKCGKLAYGPIEQVGQSQMGLGREIKDYSSSTFNVDGTSSTTVRSYAKRMSVDVVVDNDEIDWVIDLMEGYRQTSVVFVGSTEYTSTLIFGKYASFRNIIEGPSHSKMALQIEGTV